VEDLRQAVNLMRGPKGTSVKVTIMREGVKEPMAFDLVRDVIPVKSIKARVLQPGYGYIWITNFTGHTTDDFLSALEKIESENKPLKGLVLDLRNNGGGHMNHSMFWKAMKKGGGGEPSGELADAIKGTFGNFGDFRKTFAQAATTRFGSGWAWLLIRGGKLAVESTANQDNPVMDGGKAIFGLDVWEHAYYLKYQNRRAEYVDNFMKIINWEEVVKRYAKVKGLVGYR